VAENDPATWDPAPGLVSDAAELFSDSVYDRGAMTLQALRVEVGDATFLRILRDWFAEHEYGNATTADFIALAQRDSRRDLSRFFQKWLFTPGPVVAAATGARQPAGALAARPHHRR
jgi:aminopeptidase N